VLLVSRPLSLFIIIYYLLSVLVSLYLDSLLLDYCLCFVWFACTSACLIDYNYIPTPIIISPAAPLPSAPLLSLLPNHIMPYNTRRKSLSLPLLGIHLPNSSRRSPSTSKPHATDENLPPSKKVKRSHDSALTSPEPSEHGTNAVQQSVTARLIKRRGNLDQTPPLSPTDGSVAPKIDIEGINDDVVVGVIEQLEKTGNRPHLVKELAAVLINFNESVTK
jgi:hypothetical protein